MKEMKILWVDDEVDLLKPFVLFLQAKGYQVDTATNGTDAIEMVLHTKYDLVLLDESMPGLDGLDTLKELKLINPSLAVVMVTKNEEEGLMDKAIASQIADYLIKPVNPNQIIMAIKKIFQADEIKANQIGQQYSQFSASLNRQLMDEPTWHEWTKIYSELCRWDVSIDEMTDDALKHMHLLEKRNSNVEFCNYIEENYQSWLESENRPNLSYDLVSEYVVPQIEASKAPVYFIIIDCMRLDQYYSIEPFIREMFNIDLELYYSILPTATPYSRNSIFAGMLPADIAKAFPRYWEEDGERENSRNRNEHQLLDAHISDLGVQLKPESKYVKIFNMEEGNFVIRRVESWKKEKLVVLVYNFLDMLAHHRSRDQILQETIPDEEALRAFTKHWFLHSPLYKTLAKIKKQGGTVIITTDHGSIRVNRATQAVGDKDTSVTVRYKEGKNLSCNERHALHIKKPEGMGLPSKNIVDNYIFAKDDYYFVYPNSYHQYQKQYNGTFQHGGISMEEMILPLAICKPKK